MSERKREERCIAVCSFSLNNDSEYIMDVEGGLVFNSSGFCIYYEDDRDPFQKLDEGDVITMDVLELYKDKKLITTFSDIQLFYLGERKAAYKKGIAVKFNKLSEKNIQSVNLAMAEFPLNDLDESKLEFDLKQICYDFSSINT